MTHRNCEIERLEGELAAKDTQITKLTAQLRAVKDFNKVHQEQHAQSRENAKLLYTTLRRAAPDVLKGIEGALWQSTNEYDKLMSEGRRWQEKCQQSERELAESREECRRLREVNKSLLDFVNFVKLTPYGDNDKMAHDLVKLTVMAQRLVAQTAQALAPKVEDK